MKWYNVWGDYGPQGFQSIGLYIYARNWQRAKNLFAKRIQRDYPHEWERMGFSNISIQEISP